jgi:aryl-alcohol dehydrogenase-like predicted oxidoreductase
MRRRTFLLSTAAAGASAPSAYPATGGDIPKRVFGKTGERLTVIGQAGGRLNMSGFEQAKAVARRAYDLGINYFDQARLYWNGRSEEVFGEALQPFRKQIFLTSKSAQRTRKGAEEDLEKSLKALRTDYLDLWQIHQVGEMAEVEQIFAPGGAIEAFEAAKKAGKCRFVGFTGHRDPEVHLAMLKKYDKYDTILMPLNPADPAYLSFERTVLPIALERGMGIQGMKGTANAGLLRSLSLADCLQYVLSLPVHCLALGCTTVGQVEDDVRIARSLRNLSSEEMAELRRRAARAAGPALENWKKDTNKAASAPVYRDGGIA